jgi:hypothetical protein
LAEHIDNTKSDQMLVTNIKDLTGVINMKNQDANVNIFPDKYHLTCM